MVNGRQAIFSEDYTPALGQNGVDPPEERPAQYTGQLFRSIVTVGFPQVLFFPLAFSNKKGDFDANIEDDRPRVPDGQMSILQGGATIQSCP